jgi:hypothetical protein
MVRDWDRRPDANPPGHQLMPGPDMPGPDMPGPDMPGLDMPRLDMPDLGA